MEFEALLSAVGSVGFPIVIALVAIWIIYKQNERHANQIERITTAHHEEITSLSDKHASEAKMITESLNANTVAIAKLTAILSGGEDR